jgi:phospholipid/cholesterol/gamma-HCH transport system substrate-binding protein
VKRTRLIETSVGLFAVVGTVLLVSTFFVLLEKEHAFERRFRLVATFDNVSGLKPGAAVQLSGIDVGSVGSVRFNEDNRADVLLEIRETFRGRVYKDAMASIATMGLLGDKIIILVSGTRRAGSVEDGDVISTERYIELTDVMDEVGPALQNMKDVLDSMSGFFASFDVPVSELEKVLTSAGQIAERLEAGEGTAGAILKDPQLYSKLVTLIEGADSTVRELKEVAADIRAASKDFPELSASARATMAKMSELVDSGKDVVDNAKLASKNFPDLVERTNRVAENLEAITENVRAASIGLPDLVTTGHEGVEQGLELVEAARKSWVVRGYLDKGTRHVPAGRTLRDTNYSEGSEK